MRGDVVAGITLAAYLMPAGIGDASLAGLPPEAGLYACLFSGLVFWLFTSSRQTTVTVTSAISLLVGSTLGPIAGGDPARYAAMASATAVMVAALALIARLFRAGAVVNFISESVLIGFKMRRRALSRQLAIAETLRHQGRPRRFLGEIRRISSATRAKPTRPRSRWAAALWRPAFRENDSSPASRWPWSW